MMSAAAKEAFDMPLQFEATIKVKFPYSVPNELYVCLPCEKCGCKVRQGNGQNPRRIVCYICRRNNKRKSENGFGDLEKRKHQMLAAKRRNAKASGVKFDITIDDVIWHEYCPVYGLKLEYFRPNDLGRRSKQWPDNLASFDKIDSNGDYVKGNVRLTSWKANRLKSNGTKNDLQRLIDTWEVR